MIRRAACVALFAPWCLLGQLRLFIVNGAEEQPVANTILPTIEVGETLDTRLRVRNVGSAPEKFLTLSVEGDGFWSIDKPLLPRLVRPDETLDFSVQFRPVVNNGASCTIRVNADAYLLLAEVRPGLTVLLDGAELGSGAMVDFGSIERGGTAKRRIVMENHTTAAIEVSLAVGGYRFRGPVGLASALSLDRGATASFEIAFEPLQAATHRGNLYINKRTYNLTGVAVDPPLPRPQIVIETEPLRSGQQARLSVRFAGPSRSSGSGTLTLEFTGRKDAAIQFLAPAGRTVPFTVVEGEDRARFNGRQELEFQTGTTAGALTFSAELGGTTDRVAVVLQELPPVIDSAHAGRTASEVELSLSGFDNARTSAPLAFIFYDAAGQRLGAVRADGGPAFRAHFESSDAGGLFALRAVFPVTGNAQRIDTVEVEIANTIGAVRRNVKIGE